MTFLILAMPPVVERLDDFVKYSKTHAFGGTGVSGASTVDRCKNQCLERADCTSFDFNPDTTFQARCFLHFALVDRYYDPKTDHYERKPCKQVVTANARCQDTYKKLDGRHGYDGKLQWRVIDVDTCRIECNNKLDCFGFDFDTIQNECYLFLDDEYTLDPRSTTGVDHYIREFTCLTSVATRRVTLQPGGKHIYTCKHHSGDNGTTLRSFTRYEINFNPLSFLQHSVSRHTVHFNFVRFRNICD